MTNQQWTVSNDTVTLTLANIDPSLGKSTILTARIARSRSCTVACITDSQLDGQIGNAVLAKTRRKRCTRAQLTSYIKDFHQEFVFDNATLGSAIERALSKGLIRYVAHNYDLHTGK